MSTIKHALIDAEDALADLDEETAAEILAEAVGTARRRRAEIMVSYDDLR